MSNKAIISVKSFSDLDKDEMIEVVTPGTFERKDDFFEAIYEESKLSGMEGTTTNIKIFEDLLVLERKGSTETKMEFKAGEVGVSLYNTPYGMLHLNIDTKELDIKMDETGGSIYAKYLLGAEGQPGILTELKVKINKKNN